MYKIFDSIDEYNVYTQYGTHVKSGCVYIVKDSSTGTFTTNNINSKQQYFDFNTSEGGLKSFIEGTYTSYVIPNHVTKIGDRAFQSHPITSITIPDTVTEIGTLAFGACSALTSITIPDSVKTIGTQAFNQCTKLATVNLGNGLESINDAAFIACSGLTSITIPDSVKTIGQYAFQQCTKLATVNLGSGLDTLNEGVFFKCSGLKRITIPDNVTYMGNSVFNQCTKLESVNIGSGLDIINNYMFYKCTSLTDIVIPDNITKIYTQAFYECTNLEKVTIGSGVTSIGPKAFANCNNLNLIYWRPKIAPSYLDSSFQIKVDATYIYPFDGINYDKWILHDIQSNYVSIIATYDVTSTEESTHLFYGTDETSAAGDDTFDTVLIDYMIVDGELTDVSSNYVFDTLGEHEVQYVLLPDVNRITGVAFQNCENLKHIKINKNVTEIGMGCFWGSDNASSISFYSETPPTFEDTYVENALYDFEDIFVPANSVQTYKTTWTGCADKIKPLS